MNSPSLMSQWIDISPAEALTPGMRTVVETEIGRVAIFNLDGEYYAIEDVCTHDGGELASGQCEGDQIICPRHGARFCIRTGKVMSPPAYEDVQTFPVRTVDGMVQVNIS